jgi:multisubunit Na+/H+ antiporter MnhG subunit
MDLNLKDEPKEWRKTALLSAAGLALVTSLLRWRHGLGTRVWLIILSVLLLAAICAMLQPRWFRGYHLFSMRLGFVISRFLGRILLMLFFLSILTPVGWILRMMGKDLLQLKRRPDATTCWEPAKEQSPLDRLF